MRMVGLKTNLKWVQLLWQFRRKMNRETERERESKNRRDTKPLEKM